MPLGSVVPVVSLIFRVTGARRCWGSFEGVALPLTVCVVVPVASAIAAPANSAAAAPRMKKNRALIGVS